MYDGINRFPIRRPAPPRPAPVDVEAMLPMLRVEAAEVAVEFLAMAAGANTVSLQRWLAINWGPDADLRDAGHPAHAEALDPSSPPWKLALARDALSTACWRYRTTTGGDGLALARQHVVRLYGEAVANCALKPLVECAADYAWLDDMLMADGPEPLPDAPEPTPAQREAAHKTMADHMLSHPDMGDLADRLEALRKACEVEGGDPHSQRTVAALAAVRASIQSALWRAEESERMQMAELLQHTLDIWVEGAGGPRILVIVGDQPPPGPVPLL